MNNREEFEKWYQDNCSDNHLSNEGYMFEAWQHQQKKIDEGHRKIESQYNMIKSIQAYGESQHKIINELRNEIEELTGIIDRCSGGECYPCDAESMPKNLMKQIKELEALNPDVPCPACGGSGYDKNEDFNDALGKCGYCNQGKISEVKALQYENERLKREVKND